MQPLNIPVVVYDKEMILVSFLNKSRRKGAKRTHLCSLVTYANGDIVIVDKNATELIDSVIELIIQNKGIVIYLREAERTVDVRFLTKNFVFMSQPHTGVVLDGDKCDRFKDIQWFLSETTLTIIDELYYFVYKYHITPNSLSMTIPDDSSYDRCGAALLKTIVKKLLED